MSVRVLSSAPDRLLITADFTALSALQLFEFWTRPELLTSWWPQVATLEGKLGGGYHFSWPKLGWNLKGHHTQFEPGLALGFTWHWEHEPHRPPREVNVRFLSQAPSGSSLELTHGVYESSEEGVEERQGHADGWVHFLGKLAKLAGPSTPVRVSEPRNAGE